MRKSVADPGFTGRVVPTTGDAKLLLGQFPALKPYKIQDSIPVECVPMLSMKDVLYGGSAVWRGQVLSRGTWEVLSRLGGGAV